MNLLGVITLLVAVQACAAQTETTTPIPTGTPSSWFQCPGIGYYPHPYDCTMYFQCTNGLAWQFECPGGLYFNAQTNRCDYPTNVACYASPTPPGFTFAHHEDRDAA